MKKKSLIRSILLGASLLAVVACKKQDNASVVSGTDAIPENFDFKTTKNVNLTLTGKSGSLIPTGAIVSVCTQPMSEDGKLLGVIAKGTLNEAGQFTSSFQVDANIEKVYAYPNYPGLASEVEIPLGNGGSVTSSLLDGQPGIKRLASNKRIAPTTDVSVPNGWNVLGGWDANGVPTYVLDPSDVINTPTLTAISKALPERQKLFLDASKKSWISTSARTSVFLKDSSDVWITYISEGAANQNSLGYFVYDKNNPPTSAAQIASKMVIAFPNFSASGSGGDMHSGDKIHLGNFGPNDAIGWFLVPYSWHVNTNGTTQVNHTNPIFYSFDEWNPETDDTLKPHVVLLNDIAEGKQLIGFEDTKRSNASCDHDFNDILFFVTAKTFSTLDTSNIPSLNPGPDCDGDGIPDSQDDYPCDPIRAFNNVSSGMLAFEDLWPASGDFDFNDMVIGYRHNIVTNARNFAVEMVSKYKVNAQGASYNNGFGIQLSASPSQVISVTSNAESKRSGSESSKAANGTDADVSDKATIIVFNQGQRLVPYGTRYYNTELTSPKENADTLTVTTTFASNTLTVAQVGTAPFNPFLFTNHDRSKEVHLPDYAPTQAANASYFGSEQDNSNPGTGKYYRTRKTNMPFALNFATNWQYPIEKAPITSAYKRFAPWAASSGQSDKNWFSGTGSYYQNLNYIYTK